MLIMFAHHVTKTCGNYTYGLLQRIPYLIHFDTNDVTNGHLIQCVLHTREISAMCIQHVKF